MDMFLMNGLTDAIKARSNWLQYWVAGLEVHYHEDRGRSIVCRKWLKSSKGMEKQASPYVLAAGEE
jgi:serine/threonine-protein kinase RsbT